MRSLNSGTKWLGLVVILLSIFTVGQSYYFTQQNTQRAEEDRRITECQAKYNSDFAAVLTQRVKWQEEDRAELNKMIYGVLTAPGAPARKKFLEDYVAQVDKNDRLRAQNPLPSLTDRNC